MAETGPIIIIDDDVDDQDILRSVLEELNVQNKPRFFNNCEDALNYLQTTLEKPFIILCDINLPRMNGLELRQLINNNEFLKQKSIPFIFWSTTAHPDAVRKAYNLTVQGFFRKKGSISDIGNSVKTVIDYWKLCVHPNSEQ